MAHDTTPTSARKRGSDTGRITISGPWTAISNRLLTDQRLSRDARFLGCLLFKYAGNTGTAFPSQHQLAQEMGSKGEAVSVRSIQRWLNELRDAGWLRWRQTLKNNTYTLLDPADSSVACTVQDDEPESAVSITTPLSPPTPPAVSSRTTTQASSSALPESPSTATAASPPTTGVSSPTMTVVSCSSIESDSSEKDSSESNTPPAHSDDGDAVVRYLQCVGISAAREFRELDLEAVRERVTQLQRDPACRPGAIVKSLRADPPTRTPTTGGRAYIDQLNAIYGDLFRSGDDLSDLSPESIAESYRHQYQPPQPRNTPYSRVGG